MRLKCFHLNLTSKLWFVLLLFFSISAGAQQTTSSMTKSMSFGKHGMVVFGGLEGLYASHMPMFHVPHDYQVLIRFHVVDPKVDQQLRQRLSRKPTLWSLDPEDFELSRLGPEHPQALQQFTAVFFEGHFERDGKARYAKQIVVIDEVLMFRQLSMQERNHTDGHYRVIGHGHERFLIKEIDRRPDFDVIIALGKKAKRLQSKVLVLPSDKMNIPSALLSLFAEQSGQVRVLYFETGDLQ
ncbi:hypothetical protein [Undibacterium sp. Di24W]|uniref:hypothetical protein n=1 Tax=Undibacterium sp. Di24W TaxID=3413033 RepID=UPI003BF3FD1C